MVKKILGLDIGSNSIGYSLLDLSEKDGKIIFEDIISNSITFSDSNSASDRRKARALRRNNSRKSARKKYARKLFAKYSITPEAFISSPTKYMNSLNIENLDVYSLREDAVNGKLLTKDEFLLATYSILTDRGYNNMFSISKEDGVINDAVVKNREKFQKSKYLLPSMVLTDQRKELENTYQNIPIRNKKNDYRNSLDREMHKEEFRVVVESQKNNKTLFPSEKAYEAFIKEVLSEEKPNDPFYQRPLKSFEDMVEYCTFYDKYNPKGSYKRAPLAHARNIESTLRQKIDNYEILNNKLGEVKTSREIFSNEELEKIINYWLHTPSANEITAKNIFKAAGFKDLILRIPEKSSQIVLNIKAHRDILLILEKYSIVFNGKDHDFYTAILLELHHYKNKSSRAERITKHIEKYSMKLNSDFIEEIILMESMDGFGSFSLEFIDEVLEKMKKEDKTHHEALESLGYYSKYLNMPTYDYLPPLEPTKADIKWLSENINYFSPKHLFYQPMMSPKVKRVIAVLRKLINEIIKKHGRIDGIRIETAKDMNSKVEKERIDESQKRDRSKNKEASKLLESHNIPVSVKNIEIAKLLKEQGGKCLYSGENITLEEAINETQAEREHFIPRSKIWINSYKNKILVNKKYNQNKLDKHPVAYLKSIGEWENFKGRVNDSFMNSRKKEWLSNEDIINSAMNKENWQDSYLNDTRSATKSIQKYLNHYLYPKEALYGKGEKRAILSVSGRAISELKYMWGIHTVMPKDSDEKKDRNTNYHHTLDAFTVALCSTTAINALHSHFKQKENKFKVKAMKEKIENEVPATKNGINVVEYLKVMVKEYENNQKYVVPYNKRKTNMKGFKDGNKKLYVTKNPKNPEEEILAELERVNIDISLLVKKQGLSFIDRTDKEVLDYIDAIKDRLDGVKQKNIIKALDVYVQQLLYLRGQIKKLEKEIKTLSSSQKTGKKYKEENELIKEEIKPLIAKKKDLTKKQQLLQCEYTVKNGKNQIVRNLNLYKNKIEKSKADAIIFHNYPNDKIERLSLNNFKKAQQDKVLFIIKENETTLYVELFNTNKGQAVGLNFFSSIANKIKPKLNTRNTKEVSSDSVANLTLYKNDIIKVLDTKKNSTNYYVFNGGGNATGGNNKIEVNYINKANVDEYGKKKRLNITPNKTTIISKVKIDIFGNIEEA